MNEAFIVPFRLLLMIRSPSRVREDSTFSMVSATLAIGAPDRPWGQTGLVCFYTAHNSVHQTGIAEK